MDSENLQKMAEDIAQMIACEQAPALARKLAPEKTLEMATEMAHSIACEKAPDLALELSYDKTHMMATKLAYNIVCKNDPLIAQEIVSRSTIEKDCKNICYMLHKVDDIVHSIIHLRACKLACKKKDTISTQDKSQKLATDMAHVIACEEAPAMAREMAIKYINDTTNEITDIEIYKNILNTAQKLSAKKIQEKAEELAHIIACEKAPAMARDMAPEQIQKMANELAHTIACENAPALAQEMAASGTIKIDYKNIHNISEYIENIVDGIFHLKACMMASKVINDEKNVSIITKKSTKLTNNMVNIVVCENAPGIIPNIVHSETAALAQKMAHIIIYVNKIC